MGHVADWVQVIRVARYLNCSPWELLDQPAAWQFWAGELMAADAQIQKDQEARQTKGFI